MKEEEQGEDSWGRDFFFRQIFVEDGQETY